MKRKDLERNLERLHKEIGKQIKDMCKRREAYSSLRTLTNLLLGNDN